MRKFQNKKKDEFLSSIPTASLDQETNNISAKMKFNFSYFDASQPRGDNISSLSKDQSNKLIKKLIEYSRESLEHWSNQKIGSGKNRNSIFVNYRDFPRNSDFIHPKHVPHQVEWGRFRLEGDLRLVGFIVPLNYHDCFHKKSGMRFDKNTFYIVFFDPEHKFFIIKK